MANKIKLKRGNKANLPVLEQGEPAVTLDTKELYVGDGSGNIAFPSKEYVDNEITVLTANKVDKVTGKGLSTNDYTTTEKNKLASIADNANNYTHPNDANTRHVTDSEKNAWNSKSNFSGSYNDLSNKPTIPTQTVVENSLTSASTTNALSANNGKILDDKINILSNRVNCLEHEKDDFVYGIRIPVTDPNPNCGVYIADCTGFTNANNTNLGCWSSTKLLDMIKPCVLRADGTVNYYLDKNDRTKKVDGTPAVLTGGDGDVMVEIPKLYWHMNNDNVNVEIRLSNYKVSSEYFCLAHAKGDVELDKIYVSSYLGFNDAGKLRSVSGKSPTVEQTIGVFRTQAQSRTNWQMIDFHTLTLLQILYLLIYKNRDSQTQLGRGYTGMASTDTKANTGGTNSKPWCFGYTGTNDGKQQNSFLGIEDFFGNCFYWIDGIFSDANRNILTATNNYNDTGSGYTNQGSSGYTADFYGYFTNIQGKNNTGFLPKGDVKGTSSTYYADYANLCPSCFPYFGGNWSNGANAGAFRLNVYYSASKSNGNLAARCVYKG